MKSFKIPLFFIATFVNVFSSCAFNFNAEPEIFIRFNQLGFLPNDIKTAVVLSKNKIEGEKISVVNSNSNNKNYTSILDKNIGAYGTFNFVYVFDFSNVRTKGDYFIQIGNVKTSGFKIDENVYENVADSLLQFFKVQRCGATNPILHEPCHLSDATKIIDDKKIILKSIDVTGGWHDAGDYVKFLNTTAFATYMMLFSYEFDPIKFGFDDNKNGIPDILEEAKVGLDWLLRCYSSNYEKLVTQVQDLRDHEVGWRLPENDSLRFDRPAFLGIGKNLIGIYSAALALAARIWNEKIQYPEFSKQCLSIAEKIYSLRNKVANIDSSGTGNYLDNNYLGKLSLGAIELYRSTTKTIYLDEAKNYADLAGPDFWWSWGNINSLAHYHLAEFFPKYKDFIEKNLLEFVATQKKNVFGKGMNLSWGTNATLLGITLQNILYKKLTNSSRFDSVAISQRDFILGKNPWGVSFITGFGTNYTKNFHHQIAYLKKQLPGGFAAGPASKNFVDSAKIAFEKNDRYFKFQSNEDYYRDDRMDYITNEPTISGNATAIFVFGILSSRK